MAYPRQSSTVHAERLANEASLYDWQRGQVHALNPTAALVWQHCDGATSPEAIAAVLRRELNVPEAEAVVDLTLRQLERHHLLAVPPDRPAGRPLPSRRALLRQGVTAALLPVIYSIAAPAPLAAQSVVAPTITSLAPNAGTAGSAVDVTITGTGFGTTVAVSGTGVTVSNLREISSTTVIATFTIAADATAGPRNVTVTTAGGTSNAMPFTVNAAAPGAPTLTAISPAQGTRATTVAVALTGTNFVVGATTVNVSGSGVAVNTVVVGSTTSLTVNFVLDPAAAAGARTVTVTTAGGTSGAQTFTINVPTGSMTFAFTGGVQTFTVPAGVTTLTVTARGAQGGVGGVLPAGGGGGSVTATLTVAANAVVNVRVGGKGVDGQAGVPGAGGFNGGGPGTAAFAGGGGGASDLRTGGDALANRVLVAGGGGGGARGGPLISPLGAGGAGGGTSGANASDVSPITTGGGGGTQSAGGAGGVNSTNSAFNGGSGFSGAGGAGGGSGLSFGGGGGGGGFFGGGGGAGHSDEGCSGGGGGSSFGPPGAVHTQGDRTGDGEVVISW